MHDPVIGSPATAGLPCRGQAQVTVMDHVVATLERVA